MINPVQDITPDGRPVEETAYLEHLAPEGVSGQWTQGGDVEYRVTAAVGSLYVISHTTR